VKLRVAHAGSIAEDIQRAFDRFGAGIIGTKLVDEGTQFSVIQFGAARFSPLFSLGGCAEDRLGSSIESLFDAESIQDLNGVGKQVHSGIPDPGRTIAQHRVSVRLGEASPRGFPQHTLGEVGSFEAGVRNGGALNGG
jgi:hypothetical protein